MQLVGRDRRVEARDHERVADLAHARRRARRRPRPDRRPGAR